ncbi:MAG: hypothetical protein QOJ54_1717 [Aliidongia sp.]|jgi:hypothetical protein|nr:hypothetical protein [Aliidongia sp.]
MKRLISTVLLAGLGLTGCDTIDSHTARRAQDELVGMRRADFFACAGLPNRSLPIEYDEYDTFDYQPFTPDNSLNATIPLIGGIALSTGGTCHATAIFQNDTLKAINYSGNTGGILGHVAQCASIVSHCLDGAKEATGKY